MSHKRLWLSGAGIAFGVSLLAHVPAQLVVTERAGKLQLFGVNGSVWRGEIEQIFYSGKALPVRNLNWKVKPAALLAGTLKAEFHEEQAPQNRGQVVVDLWSQEFELQAVQWRLPGNALDPWFRSGVSRQGRFTLDLQALRLPANGLIPNRLQGRLDWQDAALQMDSETWPVGSPTTQFSGEGYAVKGVITNSQPLLPGDSSFQCTPESCRVELSLQPAPEAPTSLSNVLLFLGLEQSGNRFSGQITLPLD
jgi:hypothetical protein